MLYIMYLKAQGTAFQQEETRKLFLTVLKTAVLDILRPS